MRTNVEIAFDASDLPGGADTILGPCRCGRDVVKVREFTITDVHNIKVNITLDEKDPRVPKVLALLAEHGEDRWVYRRDIYTEEELQAAPLIVVCPWGGVQAAAGSQYGTTYDMSQACPKCGTGARQTSPLIIDTEDLRTIEKLRIAATYDEDLLVHDADAERLLAANVTGLLLWTAYAKRKNGRLDELRRQQMFAEHVMPPMAPSSSLTRTGECTTCHRGGLAPVFGQTVRFIYRPQDLVDIQDVNRTWEGIGDFREFTGDITKALWPNPFFLITPKVMNLLRGTKKDQGVDFVPIWIENGGVARVA
jgi:hypothetical protein